MLSAEEYPLIRSDVLGMFPVEFGHTAYVTEGYTIAQHTQRVLERCAAYRSEIEPRLAGSGLTYDDFFLFLTLHDLGKGTGRAALDPGLRNPYLDKRAELDNTCELIRENGRGLGISAENIALFTAMLKYDVVGDLLKKGIDLEGASDQIVEMAVEGGVEPAQILTLMDIFHRVDCGSYPTLASLFDGGTLARLDESKFEELRADIALIEMGRTSNSMEAVTRYLRYEHQKMLLLPETAENRLHFKQVKHRVKEVFWSLIPVDSIPEYSAQGDELRKGVRLSTFTSKCRSRSITYAFIERAVNFKRSYLARYSLGKFEITDPNRTLRHEWVQGTKGPVAVALRKTAGDLVCLGGLRRAGLTPPSGAMDQGAHGVNKYALSGTALSGSHLALKYGAPKANFESTIEWWKGQFVAELAGMHELLKAVPNDLTDRADARVAGQVFCRGYVDAFTRLESYIIRLRTHAPDFIRPYQAELQDLYSRLQASYEMFKKTHHYKLLMPKSETGLEKGYHDNYNKRFLGQIEDSIANVLKVNSTEPEEMAVDAAELCGVGLLFASDHAVSQVHSLMEAQFETPLHRPMSTRLMTCYASGKVDLVQAAMPDVRVLPIEAFNEGVKHNKALMARARFVAGDPYKLAVRVAKSRVTEAGKVAAVALAALGAVVFLGMRLFASRT